MYRYEIVPVSPLFPARDLYGVLGWQEQDGSRALVAAAAPLSGDLETVAALAKTCTDLQLSPEHLLDAASDFIARTNMYP